MNFFGGGASTAGSDIAPDLSDKPESHDSMSMQSPFSQPVLALDRLKQAGVPLKAQMSPYLQVL
jgi:hypothetical protein